LRRAAAMAVAVVLGWALPAAAKDFKFNTALDGGYFWFFAYDNQASHVDINPAPCYGGTLFQIVDFSWSRNMVAELNYLYTQTRGRGYDRDSDSVAVFDLAMHHAAFNVGYFFEGRRLHPYLSGGFGASYLDYQPVGEFGQPASETDLTVNLSPGADITVWETGMAALDRLDVGFRVRYFYVFQQHIVDTAINGLALTARVNLRW
jgi:hypothetical protein